MQLKNSSWTVSVRSLLNQSVAVDWGKIHFQKSYFMTVLCFPIDINCSEWIVISRSNSFIELISITSVLLNFRNTFPHFTCIWFSRRIPEFNAICSQPLCWFIILDFEFDQDVYEMWQCGILILKCWVQMLTFLLAFHLRQCKKWRILMVKLELLEVKMTV